LGQQSILRLPSHFKNHWSKSCVVAEVIAKNQNFLGGGEFVKECIEFVADICPEKKKTVSVSVL